MECLCCQKSVGKKTNKFCDSSCAATYNNRKRSVSEETKQKIKESILAKLKKYTRVCRLCEQPFESTSNSAQHCSSCRVTRRRLPKAHNIQACCRCCGEPCKRKYCSRKCFHKAQQDARDTKIVNGEYATKHNLRTLKDFLVRTRGWSCALCGNTLWMGRAIPLVLDHINGRSLDHSLNNVRLVCGNCDMQLPTYKSKNKGSDRSFRRVAPSQGHYSSV